MGSAKANELTILAIALFAVGVAIVAFDTPFVIGSLANRMAAGDAPGDFFPTPLHNLRTILTGAFAIVLSVALLRRAVWARRTVIATAWVGAAVTGVALLLVRFIERPAFALDLGVLLPFVNAPFLLASQGVGRLCETGKIALGVRGSALLAAVFGVALPVAAALVFSTRRARAVFADPGLRVGALWRRELGAYFLSPIAYIVTAVFLFVNGLYFMYFITRTHEAGLKGPLFWMAWVLLFMIPFLTMRLVAEERRSGTLEMLLTTPVTDVEVVVSKFLGAWTFFAVMVAPTVAYVFVLRAFSTPDMGPILTGYVGIVLVGAYLVAFGLWVSALCRNQVTAGAATMIASLVMAVFFKLVDPRAVVGAGAAVDRVRRLALWCAHHLSLFDHFESFLKGVFDPQDVFFFAAFTFLWLFLAVRAIESRKWRS